MIDINAIKSAEIDSYGEAWVACPHCGCMNDVVSQDIVFGKDGYGVYKCINPLCERMFKYRENEIGNRKVAKSVCAVIGCDRCPAGDHGRDCLEHLYEWIDEQMLKNN